MPGFTILNTRHSKTQYFTTNITGTLSVHTHTMKRFSLEVTEADGDGHQQCAIAWIWNSSRASQLVACAWFPRGAVCVTLLCVTLHGARAEMGGALQCKTLNNTTAQHQTNDSTV